MTLAGVGGAFGGREDLSMQIHACDAGAAHRQAGEDGLRPRGVLLRARAPAPGADAVRATAPPREGKLVFAEVRDRAGRRRLRLGHADRRRQRRLARRRPVRGPERRDRRLRRLHQQPAVRRDARLRRGAGVLRVRVADGQARRRARAGPGARAPAQRDRRRVDACATGQVVEAPTPLVAEMLEQARGACRCRRPAGRLRHAQPARRAAQHHPRRGRACAASATASASRTSASPRASTTTPPPGCGWRSSAASRSALVHTAAAEVGQGLVTVQAQIARTELGVERVTIHPADTAVGSAGSSSASRQTYMTGGAVKTACEAVRGPRCSRGRGARSYWPIGELDRWSAARSCSASGGVLAALVDVLGDGLVEETREYHHRPTSPLDPVTGQGDSHTQLAFCRPPRGRRRGRRTRPGQGVALDAGPGRRQDHEPAGARGPDPRRHRAGPRPRAHGGDPGPRRQGAQPLVHRLPDPHHPRHAPSRSWSSSRTPTRAPPTGCAAPASRRRSPRPRRSSPRSATPPACRGYRILNRVPVRPTDIIESC